MSQREDRERLSRYIDFIFMKIKISFIRLLVGLIAGIASAPLTLLGTYIGFQSIGDISCFLPLLTIPVAYYATSVLAKALYKLEGRSLFTTGIVSFLASWALGLFIGLALLA